MSERSKTFLKDRRTGQFVEAILVDGVSREIVEAAESAWRPTVAECLRTLKSTGVSVEQWPEHTHWDWRKKQAAVEGLIAYRMFAVECECEVQGLMLVSMAGHVCRIPSQAGKDLVYVEFVASAPWNSPILVPEPRFALVGRVFIGTAIQLSVEEAFKGRIGLHSLPQAESFYGRNCRMTDLGTDPKKGNLRYFEMTPEQASDFLK